MAFTVNKPITTKQEYESALKEIEPIFEADPNTKEGQKAELLAILIEAYEDKHYPIPASDPIEAIKFRMDQMDMKSKDLGEIIGYKERASEILNRKRKLTLPMIRIISTKLNIPTAVLVQEYQIAK
jgi:HTH-type transcriptional regulator/antitoxin HigA